MAFLTEIICDSCGLKKTVLRNPSICTSVCGECERAEAVEKEKQHFDSLDKMTVEQRLRLLEKWVYNFSHKEVPPAKF